MAPRKQGQKKDFEGIKNLRVSSIFDTNDAKLKSLQEHFNVVHLVKNEMAEHILANKHLLLTKDGRYELSSQHYKLFSTDELSAWETQQIFADVADMYINALKKRNANQPFAIQSKFEVIRYKKDIKSQSGEVVAKKGDLKTFEVKKKSTLLTKFASKLISLEPQQFDAFVVAPPSPKDNETPEAFKRRFDKVVKENKYIESLKRDKSFWNRLKAVVRHRQRNILSCLKLVEFNSGSYRKAVREGSKTAAKCSHIIKTDNAKYKYYYRFKIAKKEVIYIPLAINEKYHDFEYVNFDAASYVSLNRKGHLNIGLQYTKGVSFVEHTPVTGVVKR